MTRLMSGRGNNRNSLRELYSLYAFFSSSKQDKLFISIVLVMLASSWLLNYLYLAQIAGTFTFALFVKYVILSFAENAREFDSKNPNFDHDAEVFTKGTFFMGLFFFFFGLPFTLIGISTTFALVSSLGNLPQGNVELFVAMEVFWQPFGCLSFLSAGLGLQYMGLYSCWRYLVQ